MRTNLTLEKWVKICRLISKFWSTNFQIGQQIFDSFRQEAQNQNFLENFKRKRNMTFFGLCFLLTRHHHFLLRKSKRLFKLFKSCSRMHSGIFAPWQADKMFHCVKYMCRTQAQLLFFLCWVSNLVKNHFSTFWKTLFDFFRNQTKNTLNGASFSPQQNLCKETKNNHSISVAFKNKISWDQIRLNKKEKRKSTQDNENWKARKKVSTPPQEWHITLRTRQTIRITA